MHAVPESENHSVRETKKAHTIRQRIFGKYFSDVCTSMEDRKSHVGIHLEGKDGCHSRRENAKGFYLALLGIV
jgi:hypothetical protein